MRRYIARGLSLLLALVLSFSLALNAYAYNVSAEGSLYKLDPDVIVMKDGSNRINVGGAFKKLDAPVYTTQVSKRNGVTETAKTDIPDFFFDTITYDATVFYAPLDLFTKVYGATVTYYDLGYQAIVDFKGALGVGKVSVGTANPEKAKLVNADDAAMVFVGDTIMRLTDPVQYKNNTLYVPIETFAEEVLGLYAGASDGVVWVSKELISAGNRLVSDLGRALAAAPEGMTAPDPTLVTTDIPLLPATISSTGTYMTSTAAQDLFGDGKDHEWNLYIPESHKEGTDVPLLFSLHGNGGRGASQAAKNFYRYLAEMHDIIIVYPSSTGGGIGTGRGAAWAEQFRIADDVNVDIIFLNGLIDYMIENYDIDETRVFMSGHSNGDLMTNRFASSSSGNRLAGIMNSGGAVHYSSAWTGNPLLPGAVEGGPVYSLPVYQTRGSNDLSALTLNEFGDRNPHIIDPVAEGQKMASSNEYAKFVWLKKNNTVTTPQISVIGINNYEIYASTDGSGDVLYQSIIGEPHKEVLNATQNMWDNMINRYSRNTTTHELIDNGNPDAMKGDKGAVALVAGASNAFVDNEVKALSSEVFWSDGVMYAPLNALEVGFGAALSKVSASGATITVAGKSVTVAEGSYKATVDSKTVNLDGSVIYRNGTLNVPIASFAEKVLGLNATQKVDAIYICDHAAILSYSTYYTLYRILDPVDFSEFTAMSNIMGIPTKASAGDVIDLAAGAVIFPAGATSGVDDIVWSVYSDGGTGATITGSKLTTVAEGTVRVTARVDGGTGTGSTDISSRFLQNFDIVITRPKLAESMDDIKDVNSEDWFYDDVAYVFNNKLVSATGETSFAPYNLVSRSVFVTALYRLAGEPEVTAESAFKDALKGADYSKAVIWATENGIIEGYGDGTFRPAASITREEMATILYRYEKLVGGGFTGAWAFPLSFTDTDEVSDWAYEALCWCAMNGIIIGNDDGTLAPQGTAERCQAAAVLHRFIDNIER